jgi:two-component system, cell cycle sensor histidine kinase and response regulator CckA
MIEIENNFELLEKENNELRLRVAELEKAEKDYELIRNIQRKQRQRLISLLNRLPAFVCLQAPDHSIRFANRYFRRQFGETAGRNCHEILAKSPEPCPQCLTLQIIDNKVPQRWEWDCPANGTTYEVLNYPFVDFDGTLVILKLGIDITERKRMERDLQVLKTDLEQRVAERTGQLKDTVSKLLDEVAEHRKTEAALRKSEERYAVAVAGSNEGLWDRDLATGEVYFSPRWKDILGYDNHELANNVNEWKSRIHPDEYMMVMTALNDHLQGKTQVYETEFRMRAKNGSYRWIHSRGACLRDEKGNPCRIAGSHTDITYRKEIEEALRESEKKYREIFEETRDVIFVFDADARLMDINRSVQDVLGYTVEELASLNIEDDIYCNPGDRKRFLRALFENGYVKDMEVQFRRKDEETVTVHLSATITRDINGRITGYIGTIHDMTEHKRLEEQLLQAHKMESIGLLAGGIAHDFNNLLTVISGYCETIRDNIDDGSPALHSSIDQVMHAAAKAGELTHNLLAVSRKQIINPQPVHINEAISGMHRLITRIIGEDIDFSMKLGRNRPVVMADRGQIEQVLINLAANARDAMPSGGQLLIKSKQTTLGKKSVRDIGMDKPGQYVVITVADNGAGMDEKTRQKIFEPFFSTKEIGKGTGLGLSISYGIIRQHKGAITVHSEPGSGTVFHIYLPIANTAVEDRTSLPMTIPNTGSETLLMAEDEDIVRKLLGQVLEKAGYRVICAADGNEAIDRFLEYRQDISLVITDVVMPKKNGKEIYETIKKIRPDLKFIFMSGYTADIIRMDDAFNGGVLCLSKPFSNSDLLRSIREALDNPG